MSSFSEYLHAHSDEVQKMQALLSEPMSDNGNVLVEQLRTIESYNARCLTMLAYANGFLDGAEAQYYPKIKGSTVREKDVNLKAQVLPERRFRNILDGMTVAIERRIGLGQSLLRRMGNEK